MDQHQVNVNPYALWPPTYKSRCGVLSNHQDNALPCGMRDAKLTTSIAGLFTTRELMCCAQGPDRSLETLH